MAKQGIAAGKGLAAAVFLACLGADRAAVGQDDEGRVLVDVTECVEIEAREARLACLESQLDSTPGRSAAAERADTAAGRTDAAAERADAGRANAASPRADAAAARDAAGERDQRAGVAAERAAAAPAARTEPTEAKVVDFGRTEERQRREREAPVEMFGTIAALRETVPDNQVVTLENGQVWRQVLPKRYPMMLGDEVRIYRSRWGNSYRLSAGERGGFIQVERVD